MKEPIRVNERYVVGLNQPAPEDLGELARRGYNSVVNLRTDGEEGQTMAPDQEGEQVRQAGLSYAHIPVSGDNMNHAVVDQFRNEVSALPGPVFVHCASGKRSGAFTMMHVGIDEGMSGSDVVDKALNMGFECDAQEMKDFVQDYVDRKQGN